MNIRYYLQNVNEDCREGVEKFFSEKKMSRIEKFLKPNEKDLSQLTVRVEYFEKHNAFSAKVELAFGKEVFFGEEQSHSVKKAVNQATKRLVSQLKK